MRHVPFVCVWLAAACNLAGGLAPLAAQTAAPITLVRNYAATASINSTPMLVPDGNAGAHVVFKSTRGNQGNGNLYQQHIRTDGAVSWPAEGLPVSLSPSEQNNHNAVPDGKGGFFAVWEDGRATGKSGAISNKRIYLQYVGRDGKPIWGLGGMAASTGTARQHRPQLAPDYQGGVYLFWEEEDPATAEHDIMGQHINAQGEYLWDTAGLKVCRQPGMQQNIQVASTPTQGVLVLWEDFRNGKSWKLYAQQYDYHGAPTWEAGGLGLLPERDLTQRYPSIFGDGFGGLVCVYEALGGLNIDKDIYMLRLNRYGKIVYQQPVCARSGDQTKPQVLKIGADAWVVWEDHRGKNADVYLQKMDFFTGKPALDVGGVLLSRPEGEQVNPSLSLAALAGEIVVAWEETPEASAGGAFRLSLQKVSLDGKPMWQAGGLVAGLPPVLPTEFALTGDERGGAWLAWIEPSTGGTLPLYQHVRSNGSLQFVPQGGGTNVGQPLLQQSTVRSSKIDQPVAAAGKNNDAYIAWEDFRNGEKNADIYLQRLDTNGHARWSAAGLPVCTAEGMQSLPVLVPVDGGVYVAWVDRRAADDDLYIQFIDSTGHARFAPGGIALCTAPRSQSNLRLAPMGNGRDVVAVWTDARSFYEKGFDVYAQRVDTNGKTWWPADGKPIAQADGYQTGPALAPDGKRGVIIAWMDDRDGKYNIRLQALDADGYFRYDADGIVLAPAARNQRTPRIAVSANGIAYVAWAEERAVASESVVRIKALFRDGTSAWSSLYGSDTRAVCTNAGSQTLPLLQVNGADVCVAWLDQRFEAYTNYNLFAQRLGTDGLFTWDAAGVGVGAFLQENAPCDVLLLPSGQLYAAWPHSKEKRGGVEAVRLSPGGKVTLRRTVPGEAEQRQPVLLRLGARAAMAWIEADADRGESKLQMLKLE
jgi:hypothetical protein